MALTISQITRKLLTDSISLSELKSTLSEYKSLLISSTDIELNTVENRADIKLDQGIAIGLHSAASCLDDPIRTQKFIRGTKLGIEEKLKVKQQVHLLYAGTGPFATLILPLLCHFSSNQLKVTLLDINPQSIKNVTRIIEQLGFQKHVHEIRCADATKTVFDNALTFDILLTETMQSALEKELQVVISSHLLNQMSKDAILIPQSIDLDLVKMNSLEVRSLEKIDNLMKADSEFFRLQFPIQSDWTHRKQIELTDVISSEDGFLAIATAIQVFENERIEWHESGLTWPRIISPIDADSEKESITLKYVIDPEPRFLFGTTE